MKGKFLSRRHALSIRSVAAFDNSFTSTRVDLRAHPVRVTVSPKISARLFGAWEKTYGVKWPGSSTNGSGEEWTGFIDQGVTMEGTLQLTGTFRIDGNVKGNIHLEQTLILGENAKVEGQIEGNRVGDCRAL